MIRVHRLAKGTLTTREGAEALAMPEGEARAFILAVAPDAAERDALVRCFGLHELALEDALRERHPPKLEDYDDHLFVIAHTPVQNGSRPTRKVALFLAERWILAVSRAPLPALDQVEAWVTSEHARFLVAPERVAHAILDRQMDGFESLVDDLVDRVERLECGVSERPEPACLHALQGMRREASHLARVVRVQRDVLHALSRVNHKVLSQRITPYLRDVYDHCLRIHDLLEGVRESLVAAREGYLSAVNNRLSETMRVLTVIATIMMPLSLVAGIFGMNFASMPLLRSPTGFWVAMGVMLAIALGMLAWFRRRHWL